MSETAQGKVVTTFSIESQSYSRKLQELIALNRKLSQATREVGHATVSQMQAASGAIRLLEGGMDGSIRAAERFVSMLPGVGAALKAAFPVVGAIAFSAMLVRIGKEMFDFIETSNKLAENMRSGFSAVSDQLEKQNDQLHIQKDRLDAEIAVLEGKPVNNVALALDEAKKQADDLADSLEKDRQKLEELMSKNSANWFERTFRGQGSAKDVNALIGGDLDAIQKASLAMREALHGKDSAGAAKYKALLRSAEQKAYDDAAREIATRQGSEMDLLSGRMVPYSYLHGDQATNVSTLRSLQSAMLDTMDSSDTQDAINADEAKKNALEKAKQDAEKREQAAREAQRQQLQAAREAHEQSVEHQRVLSSQLKRSREYWDNIPSQMAAQNAIARTWANPQRDPRLTEQLADLKDRLSDVVLSNGFRASRISVEQQLALGDISPHRAALVEAAESAKEFRQQMNKLTEALQRIANPLNGMTSQQRELERSKVYIEQARAVGGYSIESLKDQVAILQTGPFSEVRESFMKFAQQVTDSGRVLSEFSMNLIDGFNRAAVGAMQGQRGTFKQFGRQTLGMVEGTVLQGVEGIGIKGLNSMLKTHIGSKMGSANNPLYVRFADKLPTGPSSALSGLKGILPKSGGFFGAVAGIAKSFLPFLADGGPINGPAIVGERGPELFVPGSSGHIIPNDEAFAGGGATHIHIDARGTNPAMVHSAVSRAMQASFAGAVRATPAQMADQARRRAR